VSNVFSDNTRSKSEGATPKTSLHTNVEQEGLMSKESQKPIDCPSSQATAEGARIFGVITGTPEHHRVGYLTETVPITDKVFELAGEAKPSQLFRIAAPCAGDGCKHFKGNTCSLAKRIVEGVPAVVNALPACEIRPTCRWFRQEGKEACFRCPQVMTDKSYASDYEKQIADLTDEEVREASSVRT
jgi:hypothetical protein